MRLIAFVAILCALFYSCQSLEILVIFQHISRSHFLVFEELFKTLAKKGHYVTVITFFVQNVSIHNYRDISLAFRDEGKVGTGFLELNNLLPSRLEMYRGAHFVNQFAEISCPNLLTHPNIHSFIAEENVYDIVLAEVFNSNCHNGVIKAIKHRGPVIGM